MFRQSLHTKAPEPQSLSAHRDFFVPRNGTGVQYVRGEARVRQTTEIRPAVAALLEQLQVPLPPKLHQVESAESAYDTTDLA
jgi:hypothetical protein